DGADKRDRRHTDDQQRGEHLLREPDARPTDHWLPCSTRRIWLLRGPSAHRPSPKATGPSHRYAARLYLIGPSTRPGVDDGAGGEGHPGLGPRRQGATQAAPARVTQQSAKETFRRLQSLAVVRSETRALRIRPPPALESPKTIVADAKTRNAALRATRLAALE